MARNLCHFPLQFCQFIKNPVSRLFPVGPFCKKILQMKRALVPQGSFLHFLIHLFQMSYFGGVCCVFRHTLCFTRSRSSARLALLKRSSVPTR